MRILIVSQYYYPEQFIINDIAKTLVEKGNVVTVLTGLPTYPQGRVLAGYEKKEKRSETINGVRVIRCREANRTSSIFGIARNYLSFMRSSTRKAKRLREQYDVIFVFQVSPITSAHAAVYLKRNRHIKLVLYCLDIFPEALKSHVDENHFIFKWAKRYSRKIYNACDVIAVTSKSFIDYLHETHGVKREIIHYLPQYASDEFLHADLTKSENGFVDFMFAGNMGYAQNLEVVVCAVEHMQHKECVKVHFVGEGSDEENIKRLIREKNLENYFVFHGRVDSCLMKEKYQLADALLLTLRGNTLVAGTIPGKLQTYMTTGKPVLGAISGEANGIISQSGCGQSVEAGDDVGLAKLMDAFVMNRHAYDECGDNGKKYFCEHFAKDRFFAELEKLL